MAPWLGVSGKPSGFSDDADNDVLGSLSCGNGQLAKWGGTSWGCAPDGDGGNDWSLAGNSDTGPANFLGTSNNVGLELRVNGRRALRLEPQSLGPNLVGGHELNVVTAGAFASVIGGGGDNTGTSRVTDSHGVVGGGRNNQAGDGAGTIGDRIDATLAGGNFNTASGNSSAVGGGTANVTGGAYATIPGGLNNTAAGFYSFTAGRQAKANHAGAFVWADATAADLASTGTHQFLARAAGGFWFGSAGAPSFAAGRLINTSTGAFLSTTGVWTNVSDRDLKESIALDRQALLEALARLPISAWSYKAEPGVRHIGPVAQDFYALFGVGADDRTITTLDPAGIALAGIQELHRTTRALEEKTAELDVLKATVAGLAARVEGLQARMETLP
jgi:hypothetical protein